jgi:hypothetical protein
MPALPPISDLTDGISIWRAVAPRSRASTRQAIIAAHGDMPLDELKRRLRCKWGGPAEIRLGAGAAVMCG